MSHDEMNCGPQPLDALLDELGVKNHALVAASEEHLTHKVVQKGRKGRRLTRHSASKIARALDKVAPKETPWMPGELFSYLAKDAPRA